MQSVITRKLDYQGRITIPKPFVDALKLEPEDEVSVSLHDNIVQLAAVKNYCVFCGKEAKHTFNTKPVCEECMAKICNN